MNGSAANKNGMAVNGSKYIVPLIDNNSHRKCVESNIDNKFSNGNSNNIVNSIDANNSKRLEHLENESVSDAINGTNDANVLSAKHPFIENESSDYNNNNIDKIGKSTSMENNSSVQSLHFSGPNESYNLSSSPSTSTDVTHVSEEVVYRKRLSYRHTLRIVLRNSLCAALARLLLGIIKLIAKRGVGKAFRARLSREFWSLNSIKWAVVVGGFSSFRLLMQIFTFLSQPLHIPEKIVAFTSGCVCALPVVVMNKNTRTELCMYAFVRAAHTFCLRYIFPHLPHLLKQFNHYDTLLMCVSASQISYALIFAPSTLPPSYLHFLLKASMFSRDQLQAYSGFRRGHVVPELVSYCWEKGFALVKPNDTTSAEKMCLYIHDGYTCNTWLLRYLMRSVLTTGLPLYGPLRLGIMLTLDRKRLIQHPWRSIWRGVRSVFTSSLFLALYVGCIMRVCCYTLHHQIRGGLSFALLCSLAGLSTLLEPKNRRMDLALYCCTFSLRSFLLTQNRLGRLPYPRHWFVLLTYILSASYLLYEYEEEPKSLHPRLYALFRLVLGEKKPSRHRHGDKFVLIKPNEHSLIKVA